VPGESFEIALNFSALGILSMWSMIMICNLALQRKAKRGEIERPAYRLPWAPATNYATLVFLALVLALSYWDVPAGRIMIYAIPGVALLLVIGWFAVRRRVRALAAHHPQ
jgi:L-asparagine permease